MRKIFILLMIILFANILIASTDVSGDISGTWNSSGDGIYRVTGDILIHNQTTLTIDPGVAVNFTGNYRILVLGTLDARGNVNNSIYFKHETPGNTHYGLDFRSTSTANYLEYCRIQDGEALGGGEHGSLANNRGGGILIFNSSVSIRFCTIINNEATYGLIITHKFLRFCLTQGIENNNFA